MKGRGSLLRFLLVALLIASTAAFLRARSDHENLPPRRQLSTFPRQFEGWTSRDLGIDPSVREILGPGEFLSRIYLHPERAYIDLFIAYFPSQRTGNSIHSPKNCLPGSGWAPLESGHLQLQSRDGRSITVNRYLIGKGLDRQLVLYWYQAHDRAVASEYWAKFYLVADAIRLNRTDGALVRVSSPIGRDEALGNAEQRLAAFAQQMIPNLDDYIPR